MSELAYRYQDSVVFMETEGNITRLFFEHETAEPEGLVHDSTLAFPTAAVDEHMKVKPKTITKANNSLCKLNFLINKFLLLHKIDKKRKQL